MRADVAGVRYRLQLMAVVESAETIREGCRLAGIHHSTYYDWKRRVEAAVVAEVALCLGMCAVGWVLIVSVWKQR
jgi:hypothetical protein